MVPESLRLDHPQLLQASNSCLHLPRLLSAQQLACKRLPRRHNTQGLASGDLHVAPVGCPDTQVPSQQAKRRIVCGMQIPQLSSRPLTRFIKQPPFQPLLPAWSAPPPSCAPASRSCFLLPVRRTPALRHPFWGPVAKVQHARSVYLYGPVLRLLHHQSCRVPLQRSQSLLTPGRGSCAPRCGQTGCRQPSWQLQKRGAGRAGQTELPPWP